MVVFIILSLYYCEVAFNRSCPGSFNFYTLKDRVKG